MKKLLRTKNKVFGGVCGAFGNYLNIDPTIIRILFILSLLLYGMGLWFYLISWIVIPSEK